MSFIEVAHDSHQEHFLEFKNHQKPYTCDGCKMQGFGPRYKREPCNYDLHGDCMFPANFTPHNFFKSSEFKFLERTPNHCNKSYYKDHTRHCDACGKPVQGFVYHCEEKGWDLHPCCKNLENEPEIDGVKFELKNNGGNCLALEKLDLRGLAKKNRIGGDQGNKYWGIEGIFLKTIAAILLMDPSLFVSSFIALVG